MKRTILFVEDDQQTVDVYKTALEKADHFKVEVMMLGQDVLDRMKEIRDGKAEKPALILLDLILPDMNGLEILKEIKSRKETKYIPVYILTNHGKQEESKILPDKYILKTDCPPIKLVKLIRELLT